MNYIFAFAFGIGFASRFALLHAASGRGVGWLSRLVEFQQFTARFRWIDNHRCDPFAPRVFELFADLQPSTPKRTAPMPLTARILTGGLCGACLCAASHQSLIIGAILGGVGGIIGAFAGYEIRRRLVTALNVKDIFVALLEDLVTIGLACFFVSR